MKQEWWKPILVRAAVAAAICLSLSAIAFGAPTYKVLRYFNGTDGSGPWGGVTLDQNGNVYGTTAGGGACGTVFRLTPQKNGHWKETVLYQFGSGPDPCVPNSSVVFDSEQNLYATTVGGGTDEFGTVFELTRGSTGWAEGTLYSFGTKRGDGGSPTAGLVMDKAGNLYGTGPDGGAYGNGTVFRLTPGSESWDEEVLYAFGARKGDGDAPFAGLISDAKGNFYGTTYSGGANGSGSIYRLHSTSGDWQEQILHDFPSFSKDGQTPGWGALLRDASGSLYGTTSGGGCCGGVVYRLALGSGGHWKETIIYEFQGGESGFEPNAGVVMDKAGNLYGTADGGTYGCGVIYKLAPEPKGGWKYTVLHTFYADKGCLPEGNLVLDKKGNLYGGTAIGGPSNNGVVFELTP
jgi:uncharacterized repeat protein (TIGR03803 family)